MGNPHKAVISTNSRDIFVLLTGGDTVSIVWGKVRNTAVDSTTQGWHPRTCYCSAHKSNSAETDKPRET